MNDTRMCPYCAEEAAPPPSSAGTAARCSERPLRAGRLVPLFARPHDRRVWAASRRVRRARGGVRLPVLMTFFSLGILGR